MKSYFNYHKPKANFSLYYYAHFVFKRIEITFFIFACLALILTSKANPKISSDISMFMVSISTPAVSVASFPFNGSVGIVGYFKELSGAKAENKILKEENKKLKSLYIRALNIEKENKELRDLIKFIDIRSVKYHSARMIGRNSEIYGHNMIIDAGFNQGVKENNIVTGKEAMIGRTINIGENKSRVLLITDTNSRIPVITSNSRVRGILVGNNSDAMKISYLDKKHGIKVGDRVFTSGDGDTLPPGLLIGLVSEVKKEKVIVRMVEDINKVNMVSIIEY